MCHCILVQSGVRTSNILLNLPQYSYSYVDRVLLWSFVLIFSKPSTVPINEQALLSKYWLSELTEVTEI